MELILTDKPSKSHFTGTTQPQVFPKKVKGPKKYRSFGFTVSTIEPITKDSETHAYIEEWVKGHEFGMAIIELSTGRNPKLHAHGQVFLKTATTKDSIQKHFRKNILRLNPLSNKHAVDFSLAYDDNFINTYLEKDDFQWEICRALPEETRPYYPTQEEQDKVMAKHNAKDAFYHMLKEMWGEKKLIASTHIEAHTEIAFWLYDQMFVERTIATISDDRKRKQTVKTLIHYLYPHKFDVEGYMLTAHESEQLKNIQLIK